MGEVHWRPSKKTKKQKKELGVALTCQHLTGLEFSGLGLGLMIVVPPLWYGLDSTNDVTFRSFVP
jgi:hypothetical protein